MPVRIQLITIDEVLKAVSACVESGSNEPVLPVVKKIWDNLSIPQMFINPTPPQHFNEASENMASTYRAITILLALEVLETSSLIETYDSAIAKFRAHPLFAVVSKTMLNGTPMVEHTISEMRSMLVDATEPGEVLRLREGMRKLILEAIAGSNQ